jgi:preprotein translocase subunit SecE
MAYVAFGILIVSVVLVAWLIASRRAKIAQFYGEVAVEMQKTSWPSRDEVINSTGLVLAAIALCTLAVWGVDHILGILITLLFSAA